MEKSQGVSQYEVDDSKGVSFAFGIRASERGFGRFDVPVAIFAPEEAVEGLHGGGEVVARERVAHFADGEVEAEENPLVVAGEQRGVDLALNGEG